MIMEEVEIPRLLSNRLLHLAQISPETEVCGLIGGHDGIPTTCYPVKNIASTPKRRFQMDPAQQIQAMKTMRERDETLFAIYHSHPTAPAWPSATDLEQAAYPDALYLIVSLNTKGVLKIRGFRLNGEGQVREVSLLLKRKRD